jgi:hypothetical protein
LTESVCGASLVDTTTRHSSGAADSVLRQQQPSGCLPAATFLKLKAAALVPFFGHTSTTLRISKSGHSAVTSGVIVATAVAGSSDAFASTLSLRCTRSPRPCRCWTTCVSSCASKRRPALVSGE